MVLFVHIELSFTYLLNFDLRHYTLFFFFFFIKKSIFRVVPGPFLFSGQFNLGNVLKDKNFNNGNLIHSDSMWDIM